MNQSPPKTILFVEDDLVVQTAYRKRLEQAGFHVETAADGLEALKQLTRLVPDVVLLDLMLPKVNGVDVMRSIRRSPRLQKVPVIVLSTNSLLDGKSEAGVLDGAQRHILKENCTPASILAAIQEVMPPAAPPSPEGSRPSANP